MVRDGTVLIVDDHVEIVEAYTTYLRDRYSIRTAHSGAEALASLDEDVDVVLLDRKMPDVSGDEVLNHIRERDLTCSITMVTGVTPNLDIIDMGFDDYLLKPVSREELRRTVDSLLKRATYNSTMRDYFALVSKRAVLEEKRADDGSEGAIQELSAEIDHLEEVLDETLSQLDVDEILRRLDR